MSSVVSTSSVTGSSGTLYVSGISGLDTSALIEASVEAKMAPAYRLDTQIATAEAEVAAYEEMLSLLTGLSEAMEGLSGDEDTAVYDTYAAYLTSAGLSDVESVMAATVSEDAEVGVYEIVVEQLAKSQKVASAEMATGDTLGVDGSFILAADGADGAEITLTSDMSLEDIAAEINAVSGDTGVTATVIKSGTDAQTLVLSGSDTGVSFSATAGSGDDVLQALGITDSGGAFADVLQDAQPAILTVDGVTVTQSSNDIEDLLPGVSVNLYDDSEGETITLEVGQDLSAVLEQVEAFVDAFNAYRTFALTQQETDDNGAVADAALFGETLLKNTNSMLYDALETSVEVDGETYTLADFGITLGAGNMLVIDEDELEEALLQNADVLEAFFASGATTSSTDVGVYSAGETASGDYALAVVTDPDTGEIVSATLDGVDLEVSGNTLKGVEGTAFEGLRLIYSGDGDGSYTVSITRGFADSLIADLADVTEDVLPDVIDGLDQSIEDKQERRDGIAESAADYEEYLISYYARLETEIQAAELTLSQLEALLDSDD